MQGKVYKISKNGLALIVGYEKKRLKAYLDSRGKPTIGIGMIRYADGTPVKMGDTITDEQAESDFATTLTYYEQAVDRVTRDDISQNEFDALVSFCYNEGETALKTSTLLKHVNSRQYTPDVILADFLMWDKERKNGMLVENDGLKRRRRSEALMFNTGELNFYE